MVVCILLWSGQYINMEVVAGGGGGGVECFCKLACGFFFRIVSSFLSLRNQSKFVLPACTFGTTIFAVSLTCR